jgi:hypothetical protein
MNVSLGLFQEKIPGGGGGTPSIIWGFNFYFLDGGHFKYLYLCGGTPKIIKILVVAPQIIDGVPTPPPGIFSWKSPKLTFI